MTSNFVDYVKILVQSSKGGAGSAHLLRVKYNTKAGSVDGLGTIEDIAARIRKAIG